MPSEEMVPPVPMKATLGRFTLLTGYSSMAVQEMQQLLCHDLFEEPQTPSR